MENVIVQRVIEATNVKVNARRIDTVKIAPKFVVVKMVENVSIFLENVFVLRDTRVHCKIFFTIVVVYLVQLTSLIFRCQERCGQNAEDCKSACRCQNGGICDELTEQCKCPPGWIGDVCANRCQPGRYGLNCTHACECFNGANCDHISGKKNPLKKFFPCSIFSLFLLVFKQKSYFTNIASKNL